VIGADGVRIAVLEHGGRVLGLYAPGSDRNFLWTHRAMASEAGAVELFGSDQWHNSGGDRTWIAPEVDFFLPRFPDTSIYVQQRELDPGRYKLTMERSAAVLQARMSLRSSRTGEDVQLRIARRVAPATQPLRHERGVDAGVAYAGYTLITSLELVSPSRTAVGLWQLLQLPHGGEMLIPTYAGARPLVYFGSIADRDLSAEQGLVRYAMRSPGEHKIGIRAVSTTGRVGYAWRDGGQWSLVVRDFGVDPSGQYVDVPWSDPADLGYAVQACNVSNAALGSFSELEYHVPAIGGDTGRIQCEDVSQVWAFRGTHIAIADVSRRLLGAAPREEEQA
jgi:hypothetical protein